MMAVAVKYISTSFTPSGERLWGMLSFVVHPMYCLGLFISLPGLIVCLWAHKTYGFASASNSGVSSLICEASLPRA